MVEQQAGRLRQQAEGPHLKLQARGRDGELGMAQIFKVAKPASDDTSSNKATGAKPPQTVPPSRDRHSNAETMGDSSSKPQRLFYNSHYTGN